MREIKIGDIVKVVKSRPETSGEHSIENRVGEKFTVLKVHEDNCYVKDGNRFLTVYKDEIELLRGGCEYCKDDVDDREALIWVEGHYRIHINENNHIDSGEYPPDGTKINYCPVCGREL